MKRTGVALATTLVAVYVLCLLVQVIAPGIQASHMWVQLFTAAPAGSVRSWIDGILANAVFGLIAGHVFAWIYNKVTD